MYLNSGWRFIHDMEHRRVRSRLNVCLPPYPTPTLHRLLCQGLLAHKEQEDWV